MGQALYRKYRSKKLSEVIGQKHITDTLERAIKSGRTSHAYLFTGPRGVGKTTVARILAHEVNKLTYEEPVVHLDIIEIDAASNRRIDEVRDLREKVHISPTSAKYKVYIIDEVHMLTREAFNALLKTLEEPPEHCIFILATTESHKLPDTIVSRTQRFTFKPIEVADAQKHLTTIAKKERINIEPEALALIARYGDGSFRDSISLLDQMSSHKQKITEDYVKRFLGIPESERINSIIECIETSDSPGVIDAVNKLQEQGVDAVIAASALSTRIRTEIVNGKGGEIWIKLLKDIINVRASELPYEVLEISLLSAISGKSEGASLQSKGNGSAQATNELKSQKNPPAGQRSNLEQEFRIENWELLLERVKTKAASLYTALRLAEPRVSDGRLVLSFKFSLHQKKVSRAENIQVIENALAELGDDKLKIECVLLDSHEVQTIVAPSEQNSIQTISNIFGSAEVLES